MYKQTNKQALPPYRCNVRVQVECPLQLSLGHEGEAGALVDGDAVQSSAKQPAHNLQDNRKHFKKITSSFIYTLYFCIQKGIQKPHTFSLLGDFRYEQSICQTDYLKPYSTCKLRLVSGFSLYVLYISRRDSFGKTRVCLNSDIIKHLQLQGM